MVWKERGARVQAFPKHTPYSYLRPAIAWIVQLRTLCAHLQTSEAGTDLLQNSFKMNPTDLRYLDITRSLDLLS